MRWSWTAISGATAFQSCSIPPHQIFSTRPDLLVRDTSDNLLGYEALPVQRDWRSVDGVNHVTRTLDQHSAQYCGSCWAHAASSCFSDRLKILRAASWPDIEISVQYALNCLSKAGTCYGGSDLLLYEQLMKKGSPDE